MGGILGSIGSFIFGGGGNAAVNVVKGIDDVVDRHVATVENKEAFTKDLITLVNQDQAAAAAFAAPGVHNTSFDALVDGINRLVRPTVAIAVIGSWFGWWRLPAIDTLTAAQQQITWLIVTFYFGGRALTKDVPQAVAFLWNTIKKGGT